MTCRRCSMVAPADAAFCPGCGARLGAVCARCGTEPAPDHRFCRRCGESLGVSPAGTSPPGRFRSPEAYTPRHLAERILTSRAAVEGERKQVTVLFADLKGSMELVADRDPEEARRLLDPVLDLMMEAVHRYEGTVNQVMGDGIMALFGAPLAHEDHAVRACYAALRMQDRVRRHADAIRREQGASIEIRVGVNSGEVVVRSIGGDLRMDYSAVGQTTHLAARMEQLAPAGASSRHGRHRRPGRGVRRAEGDRAGVGQGPRRAGRGAMSSSAPGPRAPGSRRRPRAGSVASSGAMRSSGSCAARSTAPEPDTGRSWRWLASPGSASRDSSTRSFILTGRRGGWSSRRAPASHGKATSYLPAVDVLRAYFGIGAQDDHRAIREKVTGRLLTLDRALESALPPFLALLDVPGGDAAWDTLEPRERRRSTLDAVKRLLLRESQVRPLVLVVEDLHWLDAETQAVLDDLVESLPAARILLLVNYRPEYAHAWGSKTYYAQIRLDVLPPASADDLLRGLLGPDPALDRLKEMLMARTEGNPLFLEECVRALVETGALAGEPGARQLARPVESLEVPVTVQAILAARIDRLPAAEKRLLQAASVVGKDVSLELLQAVADVGSEDLPLRLEHLRAAEFLYEARLFPDPEYTFTHALTHEVAYGSLLQDRRRDLHARIARAIESLTQERRADQVERLAHHSVRGELWDLAMTYLREAAHKALARSAHREAIGPPRAGPGGSAASPGHRGDKSAGRRSAAGPGAGPRHRARGIGTSSST